MKKIILLIVLGIIAAPFVLWLLVNIGASIWFRGKMVWSEWTIPDSLYVVEGDRFVVVEPFEAGGLTYYRGSFSGSFETEVPAGTKLSIDYAEIGKHIQRIDPEE